MKKLSLYNFILSKHGAGTTEYIIISAFVAFGSLSAYNQFGDGIDNSFCKGQKFFTEEILSQESVDCLHNNIIEDDEALQDQQAENIEDSPIDEEVSIAEEETVDEENTLLEQDPPIEEDVSEFTETPPSSPLLSITVDDLADLGITGSGGVFYLDGQRYQGFRNYHDFAIYKNRFSHGDIPIHVFLRVNRDNLRLYPSRRAGYYESYRTQEGAAIFHTSGGRTVAINADGSVGTEITMNNDGTIAQETLSNFSRADYENLGLDIDGTFFNL